MIDWGKVFSKGFFTSEFWGAVGATLVIVLFTQAGASAETIQQAQDQVAIIVQAIAQAVSDVATAAVWIWYAYQRTKTKVANPQ